MGNVVVDLEGDVKQCLFQQQIIAWVISWHELILNEVDSKKGYFHNTIRSMNVDDLLKSVWTPETHQSSGVEANNGSSTSLQREGSLNLSGTLNEKMVDDVWREIQQGEKIKSSDVVKREPITAEMTLEDFLHKTGAMDESSSSPMMSMDIPGSPQCYSQHIGLSPAPSIGAFLDSPILGQKREASFPAERTIEKKLKRKIKNRESAARSRARKQAYHNELVSKVSRLEELNMRLKKEKEIDMHLPSQVCDEPKYQLRRTSSAVF